jgi:putative two-component system response regulator
MHGGELFVPKIPSYKILDVAKAIAYSHHERWDGTGYPLGLKGDEIPVSGRLMAIADVYDALISKRVYKDIIPHEVAVEIIREERGTHFDPDITDAFLELEQEFRRIAKELKDD